MGSASGPPAVLMSVTVWELHSQCASHTLLLLFLREIGQDEGRTELQGTKVEKLIETGKAILQKNDVTDLNDVRYFGYRFYPRVLNPNKICAVLKRAFFEYADDVYFRFGFHWPPFHSVEHLHLHVLAPASQIGFFSRFIYRLDSYWFITVRILNRSLKAC
ncbi:Histidine triad nucleotide-binding protein 3 [Bagarius yarrelli]|uniref:Histidine triad nucleotide-binding protein 3 n=1 Tax=Bagarius yarrelli TaxID=175774 RepID=A0A556V079_BAGYA|nr:Histidine triad nucleotide-binding protein 3 [Bagarius yarrelli]